MKTILTLAITFGALAASASAQTADFDTLQEGNYAPTITDGGVTFTNLDNGFGGAQNFCPEQADGNLTGIPGFTSPMTLGFGGWSPGPGVGFSRIISCDITTGATANTGSVEVFEFGSYAGNTITLEAYMGATLVGSQGVTIPSGFSIHHYPLSISGVSFDRLHLVGGGPQDSGAFFAVIDHVVMMGGGPFTPFCLGDGTGAACPCANSGSVGHGCQNSGSTGGALLTASGTTSPDSVVLSATGEMPTAYTIFLQGDLQLGSPVHFGDGLRCVGGTLKRLYAKNASAGAVHAPDAGLGEPSITTRSAALGDPITPGSTRYYQTYYRDPNPSFCAAPVGNTFNASNAVAIVW
ncbi:MAG TPA: hypothetical protein VGR31_16335 [Planctomycetota bacterium]|jgi:hypothetical protein|nr:hypothetical protein [Planctomycetota bacterium]